MYYTIYKTTNIINSKIYIGQHKTDNLNDDYLGSGTIINNSIRKYGKHNFKKEILYIFDNYEDMNDMEKLLVNDDFIKSDDNYNILNGGNSFYCGNTVVINKNGKYRRIHKSKFDRNIHITTLKDKLVVSNKNSTDYFVINCNEYDKSIHDTPTSGKVTVRYKDDTTSSIKLSDFDENLHTKVFGGIVVDINGKKQYIDRETFDKLNMSGIHKNKVTVYDKELNKSCHVSKEEYKNNRSRYIHNTEGYTTGRHKETNKKLRIKCTDIHLYKKDYKFSTSGQRTVYNITKGNFENIKIEDFDYNIHKNYTDKKFKVYDNDKNEIAEYFGQQKYFEELTGLPLTLWHKCLDKHVEFSSNMRKFKKFNGFIIITEDWKHEYRKRKNN